MPMIFLICFSLPASGQVTQNPIPSSYDGPLKRFLAISTGNYLYSISQGQIDLDSAMIFACKVYNLNPMLPYNGAYNDGSDSPGSVLIQEGKFKEVHELLSKSTGDNHLQLLAEMGSHFLFRPGQEQRDIDSATYYLERLDLLSLESSSRKWQIESLKLQARLEIQRGNSEKGNGYFRKAADLCREDKDEISLVHVLAEQGASLPLRSPGKIQLLDEALRLSRKNKMAINEVLILEDLLTEHFFTDHSLAKEELLKVLELLDEIGFKHKQYTYNVLAYIEVFKGDYLQAFTFGEASIKSIEETGDVAFAPLCYMRLFQIYGAVNDYESGLKWIERALDAPRTKETKILWYKPFLEFSYYMAFEEPQKALDAIEESEAGFPPTNHFESLRLTITKGLAYFNLKDMDKAKEYFDSYVALTDNLGPEHRFAVVPSDYTNLSKFYYEIGDLKGSQRFAEKITVTFKNMPVWALSDGYHSLYKIDSAQGNYQSAVSNFGKYKIYYDSAVAFAQRNKLRELQIQYETVQKDQDIQLLTKESELREAELSRANLLRNISIGGLALLLTILGLLYSRYQVKQKANDQLKHLLTEKEWLLKEVHHRVKNNLQTVLSLLESQSRHLSEEALYAIQDSQNRVYAMSLIHKKLYQSTDIASINMEEYLRELIQHLHESLMVSRVIPVSLDLDRVELDVSQAVSLGLIVNEAITNSMKYAFPDDMTGSRISISLKELDKQQIELRISDNGVGIPEHKKKNAGSLGLKLMRGLTEDIDGVFSIASEAGVQVFVRFVANVPLQMLSEKRY
ncbi:hypothetical protein B0E43_06845 [Algoriphagus sp. A40]|nr:hypothetical protein B0E43_06845 [Algoriphagus sp. A40]